MVQLIGFEYLIVHFSHSLDGIYSGTKEMRLGIAIIVHIRKHQSLIPLPVLCTCSTLATTRPESVRNTKNKTEEHPVASSIMTENNNASPEVPPEGLICVNAGSASFMSTLRVAMKDGRSLLIEDVGTSIDPVLDPVLCHRTFSKVGN